MLQWQIGKPMDVKEILYKHLQGNLPIEKEMLIDIIKKYPAFDLVRLIYLRLLQNNHDEQFVSELKRTALLIQDKELLFRFLANTHLGWNSVFQSYMDKKNATPCKELTTVDALNLIDSFFNAKGKNESACELLPETLETKDDIEDLCLDQQAYAAADYMNSLVQDDDSTEEGVTQLEHHDLIDQFLSFSESENNLKEALSSAFDSNEERLNNTDDDVSLSEVEPSEDDLLTESLAKIYIKQKRYEKALEIIKSLSLKYPKKSVYFADQIRYLEILIANIKKQH